MPLLLADNKQKGQWAVLHVYDFYRIASIVFFWGIYLYRHGYSPHLNLFFLFLLFYSVCSLLFLYLGYTKILNFDYQVVIFGTVDVLAVSTILTIMGNMESGLGILLNVTIASLSILAPGRLAIFFASLASCMLLIAGAFQFINDAQDVTAAFYSRGVYGAGFFATALTAWYLSSRIRASERLALSSNYELVAMQRINEYIVERLHSGIIYADENKKIKLINSAAREVFNLDENNTPMNLEQLSLLLSLKFDSFLEKSKGNERVTQAVLDKPYVRVHFFSAAVANNPAVLIILEDMTYIAQQAQQLKLAALGRFSASIAHELRNPLGAIAHAAQLLGEEDDLTSENLRLKQLIINNCDRMNGIIKNVLQISRREKAQSQIIDLSLFLEQFKLTFSHPGECNLLIEPLRSNLTIVFDSSQLEQILVILCDNAIQHGRNASGTVAIVIKAEFVDNKVIITVSDLGPGIPVDLRDTIFEPFFTTLRTGTGMGLFIAKDLCEINQARLVLNDVSIGCSFSITQNLADELII